jgi:hypothetical protein
MNLETGLAVGLVSLVSQPDLVALLGNTVIKTPKVRRVLLSKLLCVVVGGFD